MTAKDKVKDDLTKQLDGQGICYEFLTDEELDEIDKKWRNKFIGKRTAPGLENYRWHIFSYHGDKFDGDKATMKYKEQHPTDIYIFNERLKYGLKCKLTDKLPNIEMSDFRDDVYICHHNMKWTYVITHESPDFGPYFSL